MDRRPPLPPARSIAEFESELLGRVMQTTVQLEKDVAGLRIEVTRNAAASVAASEKHSQRLDALATEVGVMTQQSRDLALVKKIAIGLTSLLVPSLGGTVVNLIQGAQRLDQLEQRVEASLEERADVIQELAGMRASMQAVQADIVRRREEDQAYTRRLLDRLDELEEAVPPRRRR